MTILTTPNEQSTAIVTISPKDEAGQLLEFEDLIDPEWQLMTPRGVIVNNREFALCPLTSLFIVLKGADLASIDGETPRRVIAIRFHYNSSTHGPNLPCVVEEVFSIKNLVSQSS